MIFHALFSFSIIVIERKYNEKRIVINRQNEEVGSDVKRGIGIDFDGHRFFVTDEEYNEILYGDKRILKVAEKSDVRIGEGFAVPGSGEEKKQDFTNVVRFILETIHLEKDQFSETHILYIASDDHGLLELPWETVGGNFNGVIVREVLTCSPCAYDSNKNDLLIISSYAHKRSGQDDLDYIGSYLRMEIKEILNTCIENDEQNVSLDGFRWHRHATERLMSEQKMDFEKYGYAHFCMHGSPDGGIYISVNKNERRKDIHRFSNEELLSVFSGCNYNVVVFATCFSGGGLNEQLPSPAFLFVKNGLSIFSIGYLGSVKSYCCREFSNIFYRCLSQENNIDVAYTDAMRAYKKNSKIGDLAYVPLLYKRVL